MIDPKDLNLDPIAIKRKMRELGIDMATLEKVAKTIEKEVPELQSVLRKQSREKGFEGGVESAYKEVQDIFDHDEVTPDGEEK